METIAQVVPASQALPDWPVFPEEKMDAKIALPATMQWWPSHKAQLDFYKGQRGGTLPEAVRLSSRFGTPILLAFSGLLFGRNPRFYPMVIWVEAEDFMLLRELQTYRPQPLSELSTLAHRRGVQKLIMCGGLDTMAEMEGRR